MPHPLQLRVLVDKQQGKLVAQQRSQSKRASLPREPCQHTQSKFIAHLLWAVALGGSSLGGGTPSPALTAPDKERLAPWQKNRSASRMLAEQRVCGSLLLIGALG